MQKQKGKNDRKTICREKNKRLGKEILLKQ
jgi:hypothetical protein